MAPQSVPRIRAGSLEIKGQPASHLSSELDPTATPLPPTDVTRVLYDKHLTRSFHHARIPR